MFRWLSWRKTENRSVDYSELISAQHLADAGAKPSEPPRRIGRATWCGLDGARFKCGRFVADWGLRAFRACRFAEGGPRELVLYGRSLCFCFKIGDGHLAIR